MNLTGLSNFADIAEIGTGPLRQIVLVDNSTAISGTFNGIPDGSAVDIGGGKQGTLSYSGGSDGNDLTVTVWGISSPNVILGDVNLDGIVNALDIALFVEVILNGGFQGEADINQDGDVDLLDVGPFVDILEAAGG